MQSWSAEWHWKEPCISLLLVCGRSGFIMRVRKKMMEWHIHEATEWGNGGHTALEAERGWPLIPCLSVFLWLWALKHTQPIWFNKGRKQTVLEPWETAERGWRRVKLICHTMGCRVWGGGDAWRVKRSGNSYSTGKMDVTTADLSAVLQCDFWG